MEVASTTTPGIQYRLLSAMQSISMLERGIKPHPCIHCESRDGSRALQGVDSIRPISNLQGTDTIPACGDLQDQSSRTWVD